PFVSRNACRRPGPNRINAMHLVHKKTNRTAVALCRASTSSFAELPLRKTWMAGTNPAMTLRWWTGLGIQARCAVTPSHDRSSQSAASRHRPLTFKTVGHIESSMARPSVKEQIVEAGLKTFHEKGFNGCGVQEITACAGVPKGSFYNHFES